MCLLRYLICLALITCIASDQAIGQQLQDPSQVFQIIFEQQKTAQQNVQDLDQLPDARSFSYTFNNVRVSTIERYLRYAGIKLPIQIVGQLSGWVWAQNQGNFFSLSDYAVELNVTSPLLVIEGYAIQNASLRLGYKAGNWEIRSITGGLLDQPDLDRAKVVIHFNASGGLPSESNERAQMVIVGDRFSLPRLLELLDLQTVQANGRGTLAVRINTTRANLTDPSQWNATGSILLSQLEHELIQPVALDATLRLNENQVTVSNAILRSMNGEQLKFRGTLQTDAPNSYQLQVSKQPANPKAFFADAVLPDIHYENLSLGLKISGDLESQIWKAAIDADSELAVFENQSFQNLSVRGPLNPSDAGPLEFQTNYGGGSLRGSYHLISYATDQVSTRLQADVQDLNLRDVLRDPNDPLAVESIPEATFTGNVDLGWKGIQPEEPKSIHGSIDGHLISSVFGVFEQAQITAVKDPQQDVIRVGAKLEEGASKLGVTTNLEWLEWNRVVYDASIDAKETIVLLDRVVPIQLPSGLGNRFIIDGNLDFAGEYPESTIRVADFDLNYALASYNDKPFGLLDAKGNYAPEAVNVEDATLFLEDRTAAAKLHWRLDGMGENEVHFELEQWQLNDLLELAGGPIPMQGVTGQVNASIDATKEASSDNAAWLVNGLLSLDQVAIGDSPIGNLTATLSSEVVAPQEGSEQTSNSTSAKIEIEGDVLGGNASGEVHYSSADTANKSLISGNLQVQQVVLPRLVQLWQSNQASQQIEGNVTGNVEFQLDEQFNLEGDVQVDLSQFRIQSRLITDQASVRASFNNDEVLVERFDLPFGEGTIRGGATLSVEPRFRTAASLDFRNVDLSQFVALIDLDLANSYQGRVSGRLVPTIDQRGLQARGSIMGQKLQVLDIPIDEAKSTISLSSNFAQGTVKTNLRNVTGQAFGGRLTGNIDLISTRNFGFESNLSIDDGELEQFTAWSGTGDYLGHGVFDAELQLAANNYRSIGDLQGVLALEFGPTDARSVPLINPIARSVPAVGLPRTTFDQGSLDARINQGQLRIQRSLLYNPTLWMSAAGSVGLANSSLDLEVTVFTGSTGDSPVIEAALRNLVAIPDPTVQAISAFTQAISNRTVYLDVGGTVNSPVIRVQTARTVSRYVIESFVRQFARNAIIPAAASSAQ